MTTEALIAENEQLRQQLAELQSVLAQKAHELAELRRLLFGAKRERFVPTEGAADQLNLFHPEMSIKEVAEQVAPEMITVQRRKVTATPPKREPLPAHLPREVIVLEPAVEDLSELKKIGEEVTETLDYRPARLVVIRRVRPKYVDPRDEDRGVLICPPLPRPIDKCLAEPSLLAQVLIDKYADHIPLYRQAQRFVREGISLPSSTLSDWVTRVAHLLTPLAKALLVQVRQSGYMQVDETTIQVQDERHKGKTHRGYQWVYHSPERRLVYMAYHPSRGREGPAEVLEGYTGALQSDGYTVYDEYDQHPQITTYNCLAHARRYFDRARDSDPEAAAYALTQFQQLYAIERKLREAEASPDERRRVRQLDARPVLDELHQWMQEKITTPKSPLGQAIHYSLTRWDKLTRYCEDGRIEIDNNRIENAIRPMALGRKNYLFAGSHAAAGRAAVIYSLLGTCKLHEVNPQEWLTDVLSRIATHPINRVSELLPHEWKILRKR